MKIKNSLALGLVLINCVALYAHESEVQKIGIWQRIYNAIKEDRGLRHISSFYGDADLSVENELYIRNLLKKLGLEDVDSIKIKRLSKIAQYNGMGEKNACAVGTIGLPRYIFVNEQWFNTLSNEAKDFLIAHEAMHLKYNHSNKRLALTSAALIGLVGFYKFADELIKSLGYVCSQDECTYQIIDTSKFNFMLPATIVSGILFLGSTFGMQPLSRAQEHEADAQAAILLDTVEGAEQIFQEFEAYQQELDAELPQREDLKTLRNQLSEKHSTHPNNKDRIAHIHKEIEKYRAKKAQQRQ